MNTTAHAARRLLHQEQFGVLSTLSKKLGGYPFGSIAGYMLDAAACPILLISTLAEHTRNIDADSRVSLLAHEAAADWQDHGRVTVIGRAARITDANGALRRRYLRYFPQASQYFALPDFSFYRITPEKIRLIGGFGDIHWLDAADFLVPPSPLAEQEETLIDFMNQERRDALQAYCRRCGQHAAATVEIAGIDPEGFDLRADASLLRVEFPSPITDAAQAPGALADRLKAAP